MAVMGSTDRTATGALFQSDESLLRDALGAVTKADIQAAIAAVDDWVENNKVSFNNALPTAAKNALSTAQKAKLLLYVVRRRYEVGA